MIQDLANIIYTQANINRAAEYLKFRKIDCTRMQYPPTLTDEDISPYWCFKRSYFPKFFTSSIYFPLVDIEDPKKLVGFDVRYVGVDKTRLRYHKFKADGIQTLLYFTQELDKIDPNKPLIITEGIVDAETIRDLGFAVLSPLTAMHSFKFCLFLKAVSNNIYFAYDNDEAGRKAVQNINKEISVEPKFRSAFHFLNYTGKDLNDSCRDYGKEYLFQMLRSQIKG